MCGRFSLDTTKSEIAKEFKCVAKPCLKAYRVAFKRSSFNIAPSQDITVVINSNDENENDHNEAVLMRWGLIPSWVKSLDSWKGNLINARVETIEEKPSFRNGFKKRPCLIPISGFYEWSKNKQPYYFQTGQELLALAGIWESWVNPETEKKLLSCAIITTEAKGAIAEIHHRMPVIITSEYYDLWLAKVDGRKELIESLPEVDLQLYPVSKTVNSTKNDSPDCIAPIL